MSPGEALEGLDDVPWAALEGPWVPEYLLTVAAGVDEDEDDDEYQEALSELQQQIVAGGVIWEVSAYAMPFLARLAVAGVETVEMLGMLGAIGASDDEVRVTEPGRARREFARQVRVVSVLRDHGDPRIRAALAWTLSRDVGGSAGALAILREWWDGGEADPSVRCAILRAMLELDPVTAAATADRSEDGTGPGERLIAAWAHATAGDPWTPALQEAATAWVPGGTGFPRRWWIDDVSWSDPFVRLMQALAARGESGTAAAVAAGALARLAPDGSGVRLRDIVWAIEDADRCSPLPRGAVVPALARAAGAAGDAEDRKSAFTLLRKLGSASVAENS